MSLSAELVHWEASGHPGLPSLFKEIFLYHLDEVWITGFPLRPERI
jgi:hypothetical protein